MPPHLWEMESSDPDPSSRRPIAPTMDWPRSIGHALFRDVLFGHSKWQFQSLEYSSVEQDKLGRERCLFEAIQRGGRAAQGTGNLVRHSSGITWF